MRKIVMQMMTALDGRIDKPYEWMDHVSEDHYQAIEGLYRRYDTELVGRTTYEEMVGYWPEALRSGEGTQTNRAMAQRMHDNEKLVFSRSGAKGLSAWHNVRQVVVADDDAVVGLVIDLKSRAGKDIHLAGGAGLVQTLVRLGLVDEYRLFVYPTLAQGEAWFGAVRETRPLTLIDVKRFEDGVVGLGYLAQGTSIGHRPERFTEMLD